MKMKSSRKGSITAIVGLVIFLAVGLISMMLYFAGSGLFPRMASVLQEAGVLETNLSVEEPPIFEISPQMLDQRRADIFSRGYRYQVSFAGAFDVGGTLGGIGISDTSYFWIDEQFNEGETPIGERESIPRLEHITSGRAGLSQSDIWNIDEVTRGRIRLTYQTDEGMQAAEADVQPAEGSTRAMLQVPYTLSTGEVVRIDIAELRYLGLNENERRIRYEIVPSYSQASIQGDTHENP